MPLHKDSSGQWWGTEKDGSISTLRCSLCYENDAFISGDCTLEQMQDIVEKNMQEQWFGRLMRTMARLQMPYLARRKGTQPKKMWFKRKIYGYWWTPSSREGRATVFVYLAFLLYWVGRFEQIDSGQHSARDTFVNFLLPVLLWTVVLIALSYRKGEPPKRQWGKKE